MKSRLTIEIYAVEFRGWMAKASIIWEGASWPFEPRLKAKLFLARVCTFTGRIQAPFLHPLKL